MGNESRSRGNPSVLMDDKGETSRISRPGNSQSGPQASIKDAEAAQQKGDPEVLLRVENLCKKYRSGSERLVVFDGLCLTVRRGEMVAIVGESGTGKSTLLHLLAALDRPSSGSVYFASTWLGKLTANQAADFRNREIGYVWQLHYLLPEFSALENAAMPLLARGEHETLAFSKAERLLSEVGLQARAHHRAGELSGGEQQRVSLARALVGEPRLLLADEPTGNLDTRTAESVFELLTSLHRRRQLTSILVTHNMDLAQRCERILRLSNGRLEEIENRSSGPGPEPISDPKPESNPGRAPGHLTASTALSVNSRSETA